MDEPSSKGLKVHHGEPDLEVEYEGSNETTTSISDDEDEEDDEKAKASSSGRDGSSSNKLNRDSVGSSQATVSTAFPSASLREGINGRKPSRQARFDLQLADPGLSWQDLAT